MSVAEQLDYMETRQTRAELLELLVEQARVARQRKRAEPKNEGKRVVSQEDVLQEAIAFERELEAFEAPAP